MSYRINITAQAQNDLREIFNYIAVKLRSPQNAEGQLNRLEESIASLGDMPERFRFMTKSRGAAEICALCL